MIFSCIICNLIVERYNKGHYDIYELTAVATVSLNCWNSCEDLFVSCGVKVCCSLNPNLIFGSGFAAAIVVGEPVGVIPGGVDVPFTGGELALPRNFMKYLLAIKMT